MTNTKIVATLILLLFCLPAIAGEPLDAVIRDLHVHGYASPVNAVARLRDAGPPSVASPLAERQRYYAAIGRYASLEPQDGMDALVKEAVAQLGSMASKEACATCEIDLTLIHAQSAMARRDIDASSRALDVADSLADGATKEQQQWWHYLKARLARFRGRLDQGVAEALPAAHLAEQLGYSGDQVSALSLLIAINAYMDAHTRAEEVGREAFTIAKRLNNRRLMAEVQLNLGFSYIRSKQSAKQLEALNNALAITEGDPTLVGIRTNTLSNLSDYWLSNSDWAQALSYAERAVELSRSMDDRAVLIFALTNQGVARAHLGQVQAGVADVQAAIEITRSLGMNNDEAEVTNELVRIYERAGRYREAYEKLRSIEALRQEATRQVRDKAVMELQEKYSTEKREHEIERLAGANRIKEAELVAQTWQWRLWAALAVTLALAGLVLLQWLGRVRNANRRLSGDVAVLAEQSSHDPLTHAFNRRQGQILLTHHTEAARAALPGAMPVVGLMLLDLDFFKLVNDTHGHAAGDKVLVTVAQRLSGLLRSHDAVVRWGGEEFLLVLPNIRLDALAMLAGRVLHAIGSEPIDIGNQTITVTASAGCVASPFGNITKMETLVELADLALYHAKATGRNCAICVGGAEPDLDMATLGQDLAIANAAGVVRMDTVQGPPKLDNGSRNAPETTMASP